MKKLIALIVGLMASIFAHPVGAQDICGRVSSEGSRVVGGVGSSDSLWPGFVRLENDYWGPFCAGTAIADEWILTAAHCVIDGGDVAKAGDFYAGIRADFLWEPSDTLLEIEEVFVHPEYNEERIDFGHDIALIKVEGPVTSDFAELVPYDEYEELLEDAECLQLVGWGDTEAWSPEADYSERSAEDLLGQIEELLAMGLLAEQSIEEMRSGGYEQRFISFAIAAGLPGVLNDLMEDAGAQQELLELEETLDFGDGFNRAQVPIKNPEECGEDGTGHLGDLRGIVCAGFDEGGIDTCQGDSGGPVYIQFGSSDDPSREIYQVGITSWGYGCAVAGKPAIYTNTSAYLPWIEEIMASD